MTQAYSIGTPGQPWGDAQKATWLAQQIIKRSYDEQVISKITSLKTDFDVEQYGALPYDTDRYPLFVIKTRHWHSTKPTILVTGGVHGYETSGVQGAIRFVATQANNYADKFNIIIAPCISPWGYETINRWNPLAVDPNRSFINNSPAPESEAIMSYIKASGVDIFAHIDLHETTDTDNSEFRPALAARDNKVQHNWNIPDGFYLVGDTKQPQASFQAAIIQAVEKITHIAPADNNDNLIGVPLEQHGVINYDTKGLGLCAGFTEASYVSTTEVYPDSPLVDDENCILAQVAAICGGLNFLANVK